MKVTHTISLAMLLATATVARAGINHEFTFDNVATGATANSVPQSVGLDIDFSNAAFLPDYDMLGDPIPGSDRWRPDPAAPPVYVDNPDAWGRGNAPSPLNALEAVFQPVLMTFAAPFTFDPAGFSLVLDLDAFGIDGTQPGNEDISIHFFGAGGVLLSQIGIDQTTPGFTVSTGGLVGVESILLPGGAFYDNIVIAGVPEPTTGLLLLSTLPLLIRRRRR